MPELEIVLLAHKNVLHASEPNATHAEVDFISITECVYQIVQLRSITLTAPQKLLTITYVIGEIYYAQLKVLQI